MYTYRVQNDDEMMIAICVKTLVSMTLESQATPIKWLEMEAHADPSATPSLFICQQHDRARYDTRTYMSTAQSIPVLAMDQTQRPASPWLQVSE